MSQALTICMCFLLGLLLGAVGGFWYWVAVLKHPKGRAQVLHSLAEESPFEYSQQCPACQHVLRMERWQNGDADAPPTDDHRCS